MPQSLCVWLNFLIYADYFMLQRIIELCSEKIQACIRVKNVIPLYLIAQAHNAVQLETKCLQFIVVNEAAVYKNSAYLKLAQQQPHLVQLIRENVELEMNEDYVCLSVKRFIQSHSKSTFPAFKNQVRPSIKRNQDSRKVN